MREILINIMLILFVVVSGCSNTTSRLNPEFDLLTKSIRSVVIIPVESNIVLLGGDNYYGQFPELEEQIAANLTALAEEVLTQNNFEVVPFDENNKELLGALSVASKGDNPYRFRHHRDVMGVGVAIPQLDAENLTAKADESILKIAELSNADSVLFVFFKGADRTTGKIVKDSVVIGIYSLLGAPRRHVNKAGYSVYAVLSDRISGQYLWADRIRSKYLRDGKEGRVFDSFPVPVQEEVGK